MSDTSDNFHDGDDDDDGYYDFVDDDGELMGECDYVGALCSPKVQQKVV